ncbi:polyprenyl diphosphate synthase [Thiomonas bhubaneswarensis]|uniref:Isoprenyl transferase n=1 Tax=Thiomonas bhubaneswarensis TaxID=339866 RepID=A0A0K6I6D3_9BURK|nr:polyprenyl diphosphate synthase [Thiomonas bhubaneswarensis]CUA98641.1 undecaprenyl diphosphate synthase [Thiomonas bhubaneswarensis]
MTKKPAAKRDPATLPQHVAVVMDGNGRWAQRRFLPRSSGHKFGVDALKKIVRHCAEIGVAHLTVFAFSSENWTRPAEEVQTLMDLFVKALQKESPELARQGVRLHVVGDLSAFSAEMRALIDQAEALTAENRKLVLNVALNYGGRWDILQAAQAVWATQDQPTAEALARHMALAHSPDPDLLIRTGGEHRISNFLLWQLAYTELYFTDVLWPDFGPDAFDLALADYASRQRRFGGVPEPKSPAAA